MESTFSSRKNARIAANESANTEEDVMVMNCAINCMYLALFNGVAADCGHATAGKAAFEETSAGAGDCTNTACDNHKD